jgi:hypothetical protein
MMERTQSLCSSVVIYSRKNSLELSEKISALTTKTYGEVNVYLHRFFRKINKIRFETQVESKFYSDDKQNQTHASVFFK